MRRASLLACVLVGISAPARADECASNGPQAHLDVPRTGAVVPQDVRFRVGVYPTCGAPEGGPDHEFRLVDAVGRAAPLRREDWHGELEFVPEVPLSPGPWRFEVRRPQWLLQPGGCADATCPPEHVLGLGPWEAMSEVTVAAGVDAGPPRFAGIAEAQARAIVGDVRLSPCEAERDWVLELRLRLRAADDPGRDRDELLYLVERKAPDAGEWTPLRMFRPQPDGALSAAIWTEESAWGATWMYRIRVRDLAGNETVGARVVTVIHPSRPSRPAPP